MIQQDKRRTTQISVSVDARLRAQLETAAKLAVRSVSGEAAFRLQESFQSQQGATSARAPRSAT
jgi:hypothetical protein